MEIEEKAGEDVSDAKAGIYLGTDLNYIDQEMRVEVDMSNYATRGMLSVKQKDSSQILVAFISKSLNLTKYNYKIYDKEMLAIIRCLESWRHYLEGARVQFEIWTNHKNLQYFMSSQKLNYRQA